MKKKKGLLGKAMGILFKKKGRVKDKGIKKGKKSIAEIIGMRKSKYDKRD